MISHDTPTSGTGGDCNSGLVSFSTASVRYGVSFLGYLPVPVDGNGGRYKDGEAWQRCRRHIELLHGSRCAVEWFACCCISRPRVEFKLGDVMAKLTVKKIDMSPTMVVVACRVSNSGRRIAVGCRSIT